MKLKTMLPPLYQAELKRKPVTPMDPFYQENKLTLWKVRSNQPTDKTPLLLIPAMINRHYIMDITEENSLCRALNEAGYPVFLLDWGVATPEDRWQSFSEVFTGILKRIVRKVTRHSGKPILFGYCMGGTMSSIYSACFPEDIAGLMALTAPIDFHKAGVMSQWTAKEHLDSYSVVEAIGNLPAEWTQNSFAGLKPAKWRKKWQVVWEKQNNPDFLDGFMALETWVNDNTPFPGGIWQEYISWLYQDNLLYKDLLYIGPHHASLKNIDCPVLTIVAENDHIVPIESAQPLHDLAGSSDKELLSFAGGHVGIVASKKLFPKLVSGIEDWLEKYVLLFKDNR